MNPEKQEDPRYCPICRSASVYVFTSGHARRIYECRAATCGHFFTPVLEAAQGVCARSEDMESESDASLREFDERNRRLLGLFQRQLRTTPEPVKFLDFGAGNAHIARTFKRVLQDRGVIYCLEANPACAGLYQKYGLIQVGNIGDVPEKIDFIYMIEVIEHLDDPIAVLKSLRSILNPGGMIFLSTPAGNRQESLTNAYETESHVHFFTPASLNLALRTAGFTEIAFAFHPEMYPRPAGAGVLRRLAVAGKSWLKRLLPGAAKNPGHLVGLTRPVAG